MKLFNKKQETRLEGGISVTAPELPVLRKKADIFDPKKMAINYYFDIINDESIELINQITDNYVENNTAIQDHIAQNPLIITVSGLSGEKVFKYDPQVMEQLLAEARIEAAKRGNDYNLNNLPYQNFWELVGLGSQAKELNKLSVIPALYPPLSNYMQVALNAAELVDASVSRYVNIYDSIFGKNNSEEEKNKEKKEEKRLKQIYNDLSYLRGNNIALSVDTSYGIFTNMYIQSVKLRQGDGLYTTDIEMTLKQLRFSNGTTTAADKDVMAKLNQYARANVENNGTAQGNKKSLAAKAYDGDIKIF